MTNDTERAYLAGFIDGEGTISAVLQTGPRGPGEHLHFRLTIANTNRDVLIWIRERWGGKLYEASKPRSPKHKPVLNLYWSGPHAGVVLQDALPFLIVKRRHAEIAVQLAALMVPMGRRTKGVPVEHQAPRHTLITELRALNHRGVA